MTLVEKIKNLGWWNEISKLKDILFNIDGKITTLEENPPGVGGGGGSEGGGDISGKEDKSNKQNSLNTDGTGTKYPTVDAVKTLTGSTVNTNLYTDKIIIYGDSVETGQGASPKSIYGWNVITPQILETKVDNYAIAGTALVKFTNGDNSGIDRLPIITPVYTPTMRAYISGIGLNDAASYTGTYNEANFRAAYSTLIDELIINKGWTANKIYLFLPYTTASNNLTMDATVSSIATTKGVNFIAVNAAMVAAGGNILLSDGVHPNNNGHRVIAETIANAISGTKYNYTQFNQDVSISGNLNVGQGISGGSGINGLEIRGTNEVNGAGRITIFDNIYFNKNILFPGTGLTSTPKQINFNEYVSGAVDGNNLQIKFYNGTGIGTSSTDGLGLYSLSGATARITSYNNHYFKDNLFIGNNTPTTTPNYIDFGGQYITGVATTSNTSIRGYAGAGISFSNTDGLALISTLGATVAIITLKNDSYVQGKFSTTGNTTLGTGIGGAVATPALLDLGTSYANATTTGASLKLKLFTNTGLGVDATNGLVLYSESGGSGRITSMQTHVFQGTARLKSYTVATLPIGVEGDTCYVTDAVSPTYLGALVGGGTVKCPVFYNGTAWVSH